MLGKTPFATPPSSSATARPAIMAVWWLTLKDTYTDSAAKQCIHTIDFAVMAEQLLCTNLQSHTQRSAIGNPVQQAKMVAFYRVCQRL